MRATKLTPEIEALLRNSYEQGNKQCIFAVARAAGCAPRTVRKWARKLGLVKPCRRWTRAQERYLERVYHLQSVDAIAKKLDRTPRAVMQHAQIIGIRKGDEGYTKRQIMDIFGCGNATMTKWIREGWLKTMRRHTLRPEHEDMLYISEAAIRDFIVNHRHVVSKYVDEGNFAWIIDIVTAKHEREDKDERNKNTDLAAD